MNSMKIEPFQSGIKVFHGDERTMSYINANYGIGLDWCKQKDGSFVLYGLFNNVKGIMREFKNIIVK